MPQKPITRRKLLKAIIAGSGGIAAASFLPEKWLKPVVNSGVLPAHAQASGYFLTAVNHPANVRAYVSTSEYSPPNVNQGSGTYKVASPKAEVVAVPGGVKGVFVTVSGYEFYEGQTRETDDAGIVTWDKCKLGVNSYFSGGDLVFTIPGGVSYTLTASAWNCAG